MYWKLLIENIMNGYAGGGPENEYDEIFIFTGDDEPTICLSAIRNSLAKDRSFRSQGWKRFHPDSQTGKLSRSKDLVEILEEDVIEILEKGIIKMLKPCPFCKGKAYFERVGTNRRSEIVTCGNCGCTLESNCQPWYSGKYWNMREGIKKTRTRGTKEMEQVLARLQLCWEHHQDGSDLLKKKRSHLFSLIFNDLPRAIKGDNSYSTMFLEDEEEEMKQFMIEDYAFKKFLEED